ncbi:MAG: hypothetical protein J6Y20_04340 [Lachnospiraceae bacterium]|nr:hypothetical protein [Lachnospiraceae bacterium]
MNREEILARNRKENEGKSDEWELQIFADASKLGMAVGGILAAIIVLFSRIIDVPILGLGAWAVYFAMFGSRRLYQYMKTKEGARLAQAVIGIVFGLGCFVGMIVLGLK